MRLLHLLHPLHQLPCMDPRSESEKEGNDDAVAKQSFYSGAYAIFSKPQRRRVEDSENAKLNRRLSTSTSAGDLLNLCNMHQMEFDTVNFVTAFHRMAKVPDGKTAVGERVFQEIVSQLLDRS